MIDICSKFLLTTPIKNPNKAKVKETKNNKNIINIGYLTVTSAKKVAVIKITVPTINVLVAPAPTKASTVSSVEIGEEQMSLIYTYNVQAEKTGITDLLQDLKDTGLKLKDLKTEQSTLEKIFVDLVKENNEI